MGRAVAAGQCGLQGLLALRGIGACTQGHLGLGPNGGNRRAQLMGRIRREAALRLQHAFNAPEQAIQSLHQRLHFSGHVLEHHRLQRLGLPLAQHLAELPQRQQAAPHGQPAGQRQQGQGQHQWQQHTAQHGAQDRAARRQLLAHKHLHIALGPLGREHPPFGAVGQLNGGKPALDLAQGPCAGLGRTLHELAFVEHLEDHARCIFVQRRCIGHLVVVVVGGLLHHQQGGCLGQMAVQQLIQFMARIAPDQHGCSQPHHRRQAQHQRQQTRLQGMK